MRIRWNDLALAALVCLAVTVGILRIRQHFQPPTTWSVLNDEIPEWQSFSRRTLPPPTPKALVTIVEFSDFKCGYCKKSAPAIRQVLSSFRDTVEFVYRHMPMDSDSRLAALAAECAAHQGKFESMHDVLFAHNDEIGAGEWTTFAKRAGVADLLQFTGCLSSRSSDSVLVRDSIDAVRLGLRGTPTFLINGRLLEGSLDEATLKTLIREALPSQGWRQRSAFWLRSQFLR